MTMSMPFADLDLGPVVEELVGSIQRNRTRHRAVFAEYNEAPLPISEADLFEALEEIAFASAGPTYDLFGEFPPGVFIAARRALRIVAETETTEAGQVAA